MADTLTTTTTLSTIPSGSVIATDDAGAAGHVQVVKLALSADGSATPITADSNGLEIQGAGTAGSAAGGVVSVQGVASGTAVPVSAASLPLPSGASTLAEQQTQTASLSVIDDWDESDRAKVNPIAGQAGVAAGAGAVGTTTQRVTLASDDPAVTALQLLDNTVAGTELQVDVVAALPAGTNNIGDVDVLTLPDATVVGKAADGAAVSGNPVLIAGQDGTNVQSLKTDTSGELQVDVLTLPTVTVGSSALPTGAATSALQGGGLPAALGAQGALKVEGVASGTAIPISVASIPSHAVTNAGTFAVQDATAQASLSVMDDWDNTASDGASVSGDVAHDGIDAGEPVKIGAVAIAHGTNPTAVAAADRTNTYANRAGIPFVIGGHPNVKTATYLRTDAATDDNVLAAIAGGTKYVITRITITLDEATTVGVAVRLGFGTANVPALGSTGADGVEGIIVYHPGMVPGSGIQIGDGSGIIAVGGDGEELRITNEAPTSGTLVVSVSFYTIES